MLVYEEYAGRRYVKIAPTTYFALPGCYKSWSEIERCDLCAVKTQCKEAQDELQLSKEFCDPTDS